MRQPAHTFTSLVFLGTTFPAGQRPVPRFVPPPLVYFTNYRPGSLITVGSSLPASEFLWTDPNGVTYTGKNPDAEGIFHDIGGRYTLNCTDNTKITEFNFQQVPLPIDWIRSTNLATILPGLTGLRKISFYLNSAYADNIALWVLPNTVQYVYVDRTAVTGNLTGFTLPTSIKDFYVQTSNVTGDISTITLPPTLDRFYAYGTSMTYSAGTSFTGIVTGMDINVSNCGWTQAMVDKALANAKTSTAGSGTILNVGGNNAGPSFTGYIDCLDLRARGWTVTITTPVSLLQFNINYRATYTPAYIAAAALSNSDVVWVRPDSTYVRAKAPGAMFSQTGTYSVLCSNWGLVTEVSFNQSGGRDWLRWTNLNSMFSSYLYSVVIVGAQNNIAFADDISTWVLPNSVDSCLLNDTAVSGDISNFYFPVNLTQLDIHQTSVTGDISGWSLNPYLITLIFNNTALTGNIALWANNCPQNTSGYNCFGIDYGPTGTAFTRVVSGTVLKFYDCGFTATEANKILADLVVSGADNGTLNLGTNGAVPTGQGLLDVVHLVGVHGWTITIGLPITLAFTINYQAAATAPFVQSPLSNSNFTWTRISTGATTVTKTPLASFFAGSGQYTMTATDSTQVTRISLEQAASRDWLRSTNLATILPSLTGLTRVSAHLNSAYADDISLWVLPNTVQYVYVHQTAATGDLTAFTLPTSIVDFYVHTSNVTGDISTITLPGTLVKLRANDTVMTYAAGSNFNSLATGMDIDVSDCGWDLATVEKVLTDANASAAGSGTVLNVGGTNTSPSATGYMRYQDLLARVWTVTIPSTPTLSFTLPYLISYTSPFITAASLSDSDVIWVRPDHTYVQAKAPGQMFSQTGVYRVYCTDWSQITVFDAHQSARRRWLEGATNFATMLPLMTGLITLSLYNNWYFGEDISLWVLPDSVQYLDLNTTQVKGNIQNFHLPTSLKKFIFHTNDLAVLVGNIGGWVLPANLEQISAYDFSLDGDLTGNIALWTLPSTLYRLEIGGFGFRYTTGGTALSGLQTNVNPPYINFPDCAYMDAADVNKILADVVASGATGGTLLLTGSTGNPTGQGLIDKAYLISDRGWVVTVT